LALVCDGERAPQAKIVGNQAPVTPRSRTRPLRLFGKFSGNEAQIKRLHH